MGLAQAGSRRLTTAGTGSIPLTLLLLISLASCAQGRDAAEAVTGPDLARQIEAGDPPTIIDVRSGWEYRRGHVPGAVHLPFWLAWARADDLDAPRDRPVVVYCEHGPRAALAGRSLRSAGFKRVLYLQGHMAAWRKAGLPTEK